MSFFNLKYFFMIYFRSFLKIFIIIFSALSLLQIGCSKNIENQSIPSFHDWSNGFLKATGSGKLDFNLDVGTQRFLAFQEAKKDAYFQLRREVYALPVDADKRIEDLVFSELEMDLRVDKFIKGAKVLNSRIADKERIEVDMELYLGASLKSLLGLVEKPPVSKKEQNSSPGAGL